MFIQDLCNKLTSKNIEFAIVGGVAVILHGVSRGTMDVDMVISWQQDQLIKTIEAFKEFGLVSRLPITAEQVFLSREEFIQNKNLIAWNFYNPSNITEQVDLIISYSLSNNQIQFVKANDCTIPILKIEDLIAMKLKSGRPQDIEDVKGLQEILNDD